MTASEPKVTKSGFALAEDVVDFERTSLEMVIKLARAGLETSKEVENLQKTAHVLKVAIVVHFAALIALAVCCFHFAMRGS